MKNIYESSELERTLVFFLTLINNRWSTLRSLNEQLSDHRQPEPN